MKNKATLDAAWWDELEHYKKEHWCCNTLKEGAFEEQLRFEFDYILPVKFGVNYCCQCGDPIKEGLERNEDGKEDWCCRLMHNIGFEWLEFERAENEIYTMRVNHCFHCGRQLKRSSGMWKIHNHEEKSKG